MKMYRNIINNQDVESFIDQKRKIFKNGHLWSNIVKKYIYKHFLTKKIIKIASIKNYYYFIDFKFNIHRYKKEKWLEIFFMILSNLTKILS